MHRTIFYLTGVFLALALLALLFSNSLVSFATRFFDGDGDSREYSLDETPYDVLVKTNPAFTRAEALFKQRDFAAAMGEYETALSASEDPSQEAQIKMKIAHIYREQGKFAEAIAGYKEIAGNERYARIMRAYAVENMGRTFYQYPFAGETIRRLTFTGQPYESFIADGADDALAYRRLFEYVLTFQELGASAARVANWYALEAVRLRDAKAPVEEIQEAILSAQKYIAMVESDLPRVKADINERMAAPETLFRVGRALAELSKVDGAGLVEAEDKFKQAYEIAVPAGPFTDGFTRYQYEAFLEEFYGAKRAADIRTILAGFAQNQSSYEKTAVFGTFRAAARETSSNHNRLVRLATIDPVFKRTLESIGWESADFTVR